MSPPRGLPGHKLLSGLKPRGMLGLPVLAALGAARFFAPLSPPRGLPPHGAPQAAVAGVPLLTCAGGSVRVDKFLRSKFSLNSALVEERKFKRR